MKFQNILYDARNIVVKSFPKCFEHFRESLYVIAIAISSKFP